MDIDIKDLDIMDMDRDDFKFSDFELSEKIVRALEEMNYVMPTPVQKATIEPALERKDLIVLSKTGSGKTAAFGVPALQLLSEKKLNKALILAPTRELAVQVEHEISTIAKYLSLKSIVVYGKHSIDVEIEKIKKGCDILVGTPGRVLDHIEQQNFNTRDFDLVILDEADRMLDMGFIDQVDKIISHTAKKRTTFLFSATIPEEIVRLSAKYLDNPYTIELSSDVKTVEEVEQFYINVKRNEKRSRLLDVLGHYKPDSCIVFCNTRHEVDRVTDFLVNYGITSKSIHGANSQSLRLKFLNQFKKGGFKVLVATDVAARGLHIEGLELVVNYNIPIEKDSYVHRIGRTGRAGKKGLAISFVQEGELYQMFSLEEHVGVRIEEIQIPKKSATRKEAENTKDLYGISFRELAKYDPEATGNNSKHTSSEDQSKDNQGQKKKKRRRSKKSADAPHVKTSQTIAVGEDAGVLDKDGRNSSDKASKGKQTKERQTKDNHTKGKHTKDKQTDRIVSGQDGVETDDRSQISADKTSPEQKSPAKKRRRRKKTSYQSDVIGAPSVQDQRAPEKSTTDIRSGKREVSAETSVEWPEGSLNERSEKTRQKISKETRKETSKEKVDTPIQKPDNTNQDRSNKKGLLSKVFGVFRKGGEKK